MKYKEECIENDSSLYCTWYIHEYRIMDSQRTIRGKGLTARNAWKDAYENMR